jgi:preprotein translocase subunit SecB
MNIKLVESSVDTLTLEKTDEKIKNLQFSLGTAFSADDLKSFLIIFDLILKVDDDRVLTIKYLSQFQADEEITEEYRKSHFFSVNAPAIAYPFLRAYVANFMLSSGFDPMILPTINFVKLGEDKDKE